MQNRPLAATAIGLIIVLSAAMGACKNDSGGGTLTLEGYFDRVEALDRQSQERQDEIVDRLQSEDPEEIQGAVADFGSVVAEFVDGLDDIDPPADVESAHNEAVDAGRDFQEVIDQIVEDRENITSLADLDDQFDSQEFVTTDERLTEACFALQGIADDNDIDASLNCGDEE